VASQKTLILRKFGFRSAVAAKSANTASEWLAMLVFGQQLAGIDR
jgi:hypothetical protein